MENNNREDIVFVSFDRIWSNFKKFWWICVVLTVAMMIYGAATYKASIAMSGDETANLIPVEIPEDPMERIYAGKLPVRITVDVDKYIKDNNLEVDSVMISEIKVDLLNSVIIEAGLMMGYSDFTDPVAAAYEANGYNGLSLLPGYVSDITYDKFTLERTSDENANLYSLVYTGIGGVDRITTGINVVTEYFVDYITSNVDYINIEVLSEPTVSFRIYVFGHPTDVDTSEKAFEDTKAQYAEHNAKATGTVKKYDFSFDALFEMATIIKGAVGFIIGVFIIFVIAICDKKVRTRDELDRFFEGQGAFLGEIRKKAPVTEEVTAVSIASRCEKLGVGSIILTTVGRQQQPNQLADFSVKVSNEKLKVICADGIEVSAETTKAMAKAEGIVIVVNSGEDDVHTIKSALSRINTVEGKLLGYVLSK